MEDLAPLDGLAVADRSAVGMRQQVVVALTEGVIDLGQNGLQIPARS
jgi:dUTPase